MHIINNTDDSYPGSELKRIYYTIELEPNRFIDVMVSEASSAIYVMQNEDGSEVYGSENHPHYKYNKNEAISLAKAAFEKEYELLPMSESKMQEILKTLIPFKQLKQDSGINVIYSLGSFEIGVSFESEGELGEKSDRYIYNLFSNGEYINIGGYTTKRVPVSNEIVRELTNTWNKLVHSLTARKEQEEQTKHCVTLPNASTSNINKSPTPSTHNLADVLKKAYTPSENKKNNHTESKNSSLEEKLIAATKEYNSKKKKHFHKETLSFER